MSLYDDLGVAPDATDAQIKAAHRVKARKTHPDNGGSAEDFSRIQQAYEILSDPRRRRLYDETGEMDFSDPEAKKRTEVAGLVRPAILQAIAGAPDPLKVDIIAVAAQGLRNTIAELTARINDLNRSVAQLQAVRQRIRRVHGSGDDLVLDIVDGQIREISLQIERCNDAISLNRLAVDALSGYRYGLDDPARLTGLNHDELIALAGRSR